MAKIHDIKAKKIADSRGEPTLEVEIITDDGVRIIDSVPSGTSTGSHEAKTVDVDQAVENIEQIIKPMLEDTDPSNQEEIDTKMADLDGTDDKRKIGANAILGVSLAICRAGASVAKMPLYLYLNQLYENILGQTVEVSLPTPMMVMIEGGKHGQNNLKTQEFLVMADLELGKKIWTSLKQILEERKLNAATGLEGAFIPNLNNDSEAIQLIMEAIAKTGSQIGNDVRLGLDIAQNNAQLPQDFIMKLFAEYPIFSLEDPCREDDWLQWTQTKEQLDGLSRDYLLIGDDLFTTNEERLEKGIKEKAANGILIKPNQIGTVFETLKVIAKANKAGFTHILSHRSGETRDTFLSDIAVATAAKFIKAGAPFAPERAAKYERLQAIKEEIS